MITVLEAIRWELSTLRLRVNCLEQAETILGLLRADGAVPARRAEVRHSKGNTQKVYAPALDAGTGARVRHCTWPDHSSWTDRG